MSKTQMNAAKHAMNAAKGATENAVHEAKGSMMGALKNMGEVIAFIRHLGLGDALGAIGLARRPSSFAGASVFASGVIVGAGLGMLFAPTSGAEARSFLLSRIRGAKPTDQVKPIVEKVEQVARDAMKTVAGAVEHENGAAHHAAAKVESRIKAAADKID